jgi:predicted metal-dependent phosphoesterase TrpH
MFLTEPHLHTSDVSPCGKVPAEQMVKAYKDAGYSTVCIADHFKPVFFEKLGDIPWSEKISIFLAGYYRAKKQGDELGINVILAPEFMFVGASNHYIAYGITKEFLLSHPEIVTMTVEEFYSLAKENGFAFIQAHPFRDESCFPTPESVDGFEVYNSNPRHKDFSEKTEALVKELGCPVTAGSDAHREEDIAKAGIITDAEIKTGEQLASVILSGKLTIYKGGNL